MERGRERRGKEEWREREVKEIGGEKDKEGGRVHQGREREEKRRGKEGGKKEGKKERRGKKRGKGEWREIGGCSHQL